MLPREYGDGNWKDRLTKTNGQTITYDANGNPLDHGERRYEWEEGRRLKKVWVQWKSEEGIRNGHESGSTIMLKLKFSNGNMLSGSANSTVLMTRVLQGKTDVSAQKVSEMLLWTRDIGDVEADEAWSVSYIARRNFTLNLEEVSGDAKCMCTLHERPDLFGCAEANEEFNLNVILASDYTNDTLQFENGILTVKSEVNSYYPEEDVPKAPTHCLSSTLESEV